MQEAHNTEKRDGKFILVSFEVFMKNILFTSG